jgi:hypothetical protein
MKAPSTVFHKYGWEILFAAAGLCYLGRVLSLIPAMLPYLPDDMWMDWKGSTHSIHMLWDLAKNFARDQGRRAYVGHVFLTCFSYHQSDFLWRFTFQSLPILAAYVAASVLIYQYLSFATALTSLAMLAFGTFFSNSHHLIGAYPLALPLGLTLCFAYAGLLAKPAESETRAIFALRILCFWIPLFLSEAFFALEIAALSLTLIFATNRRRLRTLWPEFLILIFWLIRYIQYARHPRAGIYDGSALSGSLTKLPITFFHFATGFLPLTDGWIVASVVALLCSLTVFIWKNRLSPSTGLALIFAAVWTAPPFLISVTPKYQQWSDLGQRIYAITFISEVGFLALVAVLVHSYGRWTRNIVSLIIASLFVIGWHSSSEQVVQGRLQQFGILDAEISKTPPSSCLDFATLIEKLRPWVLCQTPDLTCQQIVSRLVEVRGSRLCSSQNSKATF